MIHLYYKKVLSSKEQNLDFNKVKPSLTKVWSAGVFRFRRIETREDVMRNYSSVSDEKSRIRGRIQAYSELGMHKEAIRESKELIRLDPDDSSSYIDLGSTCEEDGQVERAMRCYRYALKKFPKDSRLYVNLGYCFEKYKKRDDIEMTLCEKALEIDPYNEWALNNIGAILARKDKLKESLSYYEKAYEACKHKYRFVCEHIMHNFAWALYRCRKYPRAWLIYSYLVCEYPDKPHVVCDFGRVNYKMGMYRKAVDYFAKALAISPDGRHYKRLYGAAYKKVMLIKEK